MEGNPKWTIPKGGNPRPMKPTRGRSASSTPPVVASGISNAGGRIRPRSTALQGSRHKVPKSKQKLDGGSRSNAGNGNSNPSSMVQWFEPALDLQQEPNGPTSDDENHQENLPVPQPLLPEMIEREVTMDREDLEEIGPVHSSSVSIMDLDITGDDLHHSLGPPNPRASLVARSNSETDLRHFLGLDEEPTLPPGARSSDVTQDGSFPESVPTFHDARDFEGLTSSKNNTRPSTNGKSRHKAWPGRYKVKVLENIPKKRVKKQDPKVDVDPNSPYRGEAFIDVDGQLKLGGKSFETYITRPEYRLLKDIYAPGIIASRVRASRSRSKDSSSSHHSTPRSSNKSRSISPTAATAMTPSFQGHPRVKGQSLTRLEPSTTHSEQQTESHGVELGTQTDSELPPRRTVLFDLENTSFEDFDPDDDTNSENARNQCLTSAMGICPTGLEADDTDSELDDTKVEEELLWDRKMTTAVQMVIAILSAQKAGTESLSSPLVLRAIDNLAPDELRDVMDLVNSSDNPREMWSDADDCEPGEEVENNTEVLHRLMDLYSSAYSYILGHIQAADTYDAKYPLGRDRVVSSREVKALLNGEPKTEPIETAGDTNIAETKEFDVDESTPVSSPLVFQGSLQSTYLMYSPELLEDQFRVHLRARPDRISQNIQVRDVSVRMSYEVNGVSTILSATRAKDPVSPISTGNLLLIHNQHALLLTSRIISSKYYLNRVVLQLMTLAELFLIGKFAKLTHPDTVTLSPKLYHRLREINVFSGILFQLSNDFVAALKKILGAVQKLVKFEPYCHPQSLTVIGEPTLDNLTEFTAPTTGVLRADDAFCPLLVAFDEIDSIILTGSTSLQALNQTGLCGVKVRGKYYKTVVGLMEAVKQLERGRELDFGALLVGYVVDLILLQRLQGKPGEGALDSPQRTHLWTNYHELQYLLQELTKLGKKATLISSFVSSKTMSGLRKFRDAQEVRQGFTCFRGVLESFRKKRPEELDTTEIGDKEAFQDLTLEMDSLEQDKSRLIQMLRAISNESSLSFSIF